MIKTSRKFYRIMKPEEYLRNQFDSINVQGVKQLQLKPLKGANQSYGTSDEISIIGTSRGVDRNSIADFDIFKKTLHMNRPEMIFLQISPENFIARQRFLSHKHALKKIEDYDERGIDCIDPQQPYTWEECVSVLDMLEQNELFDNIKLPQSYYTYSYPEVQNSEGGIALREKFINAIKEHVIGEDFSEHRIINQALYESLMGKQKVLLGEMPEILYRQIVANSLTLDEFKDIFKFLLECNLKLKNPISTRECAYDFLPHIFQAPKDLYMTAMLKESFQACTQISGFIENQHVDPIGHYWIPPPNGINFTEATRIPDRKITETDEDIIEKHALLDSLLEKRAWGKKYISNPFVYLTNDITKQSKEQIDNWIQCFQFHYQKYEKLKQEYNKIKYIPQYHERIYRLMDNNINLDKESFENDLQDMKQLLDSNVKLKLEKYQLKNNNLLSDNQYQNFNQQ